jgi:corrinoid protein of di/trimethylamine methyltransferase
MDLTETESDLFNALAEAVVGMDEAKTKTLAEDIVSANIDASLAIEHGLVKGMQKAGELFETEEYFIPELLVCADAMNAGLAVLKPRLSKSNGSTSRGRVVIGVVEGDTHDIGKNLVRIMLETDGFEVVDLGRDVPAVNFVEQAVNVGADIIALSTLMTTTMGSMAEVVRLLESRQVRTNIKVMVGGGPISQQFANRIGADGYAANAVGAVALARRLAPARVAA